MQLSTHLSNQARRGSNESQLSWQISSSKSTGRGADGGSWRPRTSERPLPRPRGRLSLPTAQPSAALWRSRRNRPRSSPACFTILLSLRTDSPSAQKELSHDHENDFSFDHFLSLMNDFFRFSQLRRDHNFRKLNTVFTITMVKTNNKKSSQLWVTVNKALVLI